jgi:monofunctional glycosyltransferase
MATTRTASDSPPAPPARGMGEPRRKKKSWRRRLLWLPFQLILAFLLSSFLWVLAYKWVNPPITATMLFDSNGAAREWIGIGEVDREMVRAVIAGEDAKYCSHYGFDAEALEAAYRRNLEGGSVLRGGSTITQQTAKNAFLWQGGGYFRKALEAWFSLLIETLWDKQRIMEVYLNVAETGIGTYGVQAGAQRYFGKNASQLTRQEAARIAAVLPLPKRRDAIDPGGFTRRYGNTIAARMGVVQREGLDACVYR